MIEESNVFNNQEIKIFRIYYNMPYTRNTGYPVLTPAYYCLGYGRIGSAILISSPRTKIGSQGRIYAYMKNQGLGGQYINFLIKAIGPRLSGAVWFYRR